MKNVQSVVSVRISKELLDVVDSYVANSPVKISRSAAIVYLLTRGLTEEGYDVKEE